ncbi:FHA domain-containing protein [Dyella monticola]|uniref:FHA domain-containing protein n=1 Tax=Dyella monticola TaxID=1927958 RepID=A0A370X629_9GAMM|nr:FHA domain-containing protein [Dyella monticola]RDS83730.1 FHA domain-containing protein [Dyella monticola]
MSTNTGRPHPQEAATSRAGPQGTQVLSAAEIQKLALGNLLEQDHGASTHEPLLEGVRGMHKGQRHRLHQGRQTIGRRGDNHIVIDDPSVSATHAWIINQHGHYVLMNTLSTNGTFVNDKRIHETVLAHGDKVRFGQAEFTFLTREPERTAWRRYAYAVTALLVLLVLASLAWWLY